VQVDVGNAAGVLEPRFEAGWDRGLFTIAQKDYAFLRIEQFRGSGDPVRTIETRREWLEEVDGHVLPRKMVAFQRQGLRKTEVVFSNRKLQIDIPDGLFTSGHLTRTGR